jgi:hypothetical protein
LTPVTLDTPAPRLASASWSNADFDLFFVAEGAGGMFLESDGFWVKGGEGVAFTIASRRGSHAAALTLVNGGVQNQVSLTDGATGQTLGMAPGESRRIVIPLDLQGLARVTLSSATGFRPSDSGSSDDHRRLGVRVMVEPN